MTPPDDVPAPLAPDDPREALCRRCGRCCHEKIRVGLVVLITDVPCPFLDVERRVCRVYAERFARQPHCATAARSAEAGGMPGDCPYVQDIPGYVPPLMFANHPEYWPLVARHFPGRSPIAEAARRAEEARAAQERALAAIDPGPATRPPAPGELEDFFGRRKPPPHS